MSRPQETGSYPFTLSIIFESNIKIMATQQGLSKEETNKAIVGRWFTHFWGETCNLTLLTNLQLPTCFFSIRCMTHVVVMKTSSRL